MAHGVGAQAVDEIGVTRDVVEDEVQPFAGLDRPDLVLETEGEGPVGRGGVEGLLDIHPEKEDPELDDELHVRGHRAPGVEVRG